MTYLLLHTLNECLSSSIIIISNKILLSIIREIDKNRVYTGIILIGIILKGIYTERNWQKYTGKYTERNWQR